MSEPITTNETMFEMIIKDNSDFKNLMLEMMKTNEELQNKMLDICKNGNIQNNTLMGGDASASQGQSTSAQWHLLRNGWASDGGRGDLEENENKIIKKIAKTVYIDKL